MVRVTVYLRDSTLVGAKVPQEKISRDKIIGNVGTIFLPFRNCVIFMHARDLRDFGL